MEIRINVKAEIVHVDNATGIVTLAIEGIPMDVKEQQMIDRLFPHCHREVEQMIEKEALISVITDEGSKENSIYRKN